MSNFAENLVMHERTIRRIALFLLAIMGYFQLGSTLFVHTHTLFDGSTVAHSHPFLPGSNHGHSAAAIESIASLVASMTAVEEDDADFVVPELSFEDLIPGNIADAVSAVHIVRSLRAPPFSGY